MPEAPPLEHSVPSMPPMPPMSILAAPLPPAPGAFAEAPAPPGSIPRLSLANPQDKPPPPKGALGRLAEKLPKIGGKPVVGKPVVAKPGKTAPVLRRRAALSPVAKAGLTFVILAIGVGGFYSFRIFFPEQPPDVRIRLPGLVKPITPADLKKSAADALAKAVAAPGQLIDKGQSAIAAQREQEQAKLDALAGQEEPTPTAAPTGPSQTVMGNTSISSDVKVGNTPIDAGPAASAAFRAFVASANVGGVYQGIPAKALINGSIVREGQVVDGALGVAFERIDAVKKVIYFKDYTGAVVSKNY